MKAIPDVPPEPIHMPGGSYWPVVAAIGIVGMASGAVAHTLWIVLASGALLVFSIYRWAFEPFEV
jgi:hypothetical protein